MKATVLHDLALSHFIFDPYEMLVVEMVKTQAVGFA